MSGYILRENDPSIVLTADQVDRLVKNGDGDAALLYLLLMRADRGITEQELQSWLRWSQLRLNAAEAGLQRLGLIQRPAETPLPAPAEERPARSGEPEKKEVPVPDPEAAQPQDGGAFARLFDDQAWDRYYGSPEAETPAAEPESVTESAAEPAPVSEPVSVPENPAPVPPVSTPVPPASQAAPQPAAPDLNQTLAGLQTDVQQLARGLESLSHELGRIFQYMEQQGNGSKEERK